MRNGYSMNNKQRSFVYNKVSISDKDIYIYVYHMYIFKGERLMDFKDLYRDDKFYFNSYSQAIFQYEVE